MADPLGLARTARDAARSAFLGRAARLRGELATRSIGGRIADDIQARAAGVGKEALDVAKESKAIIAGTAAALAIWFLRVPILGWIAEQWNEFSGTDNSGVGNSGADKETDDE